MSYSISTRIPYEQTMQDLKDEFRKWGISIADWDITKPDRYSNSTEITLTYKHKGRTVVLKYDGQRNIKDNLRAIYLAIQDMRMIEVRGVGDLVASAYKQIGDGNQSYENIGQLKSPYEILGIREDSDLEAAEAVYRTLARKYHPDSKPNGSVEIMDQLNKAIAQIRKEKGQ